MTILWVDCLEDVRFDGMRALFGQSRHSKMLRYPSTPQTQHDSVSVQERANPSSVVFCSSGLLSTPPDTARVYSRDIPKLEDQFEQHALQWTGAMPLLSRPPTAHESGATTKERAPEPDSGHFGILRYHHYD